MVDLEAFFFNLARGEVQSRIERNSAQGWHFTYDRLGALLFLIDWENGGEGAFQAALAFATRAKDMGLPVSFTKILMLNGLGLQDFRYENFTRKDFNWKGMPRCSELKALLDKPYDVLVDYSDGRNRYLQRILKLAKAAVKVGYGMGEATRDNYDFIIHLQQTDYMRYNQNIFNYLRHISV